MPPFDQFNALMESNARPKDLPWKHAEMVELWGKQYKVLAQLDPHDDNVGQRGYMVAAQIKEEERPRNLECFWFEIIYKSIQKRIGNQCEEDSYWYRARSLGALGE